MKNVECNEGADMMACDVVRGVGWGGAHIPSEPQTGLTFPGFSSAMHIKKK